MFDDVAVAPPPHLSGILSVPTSPPCWHGGRHCQLRPDLLLPLHGLPRREDPGGGGEQVLQCHSVTVSQCYSVTVLQCHSDRSDFMI